QMKRAIPYPLEIDDHHYGSDPITHKKNKDEHTDETTDNMAQVQSTSTTSPSTSNNTQTKMNDTTEQQSESLIKQEK
ncbi:unnamed protein product, partial [Rotaria sordida]